MTLRRFTGFLLFTALMSCAIEPAKINYGQDACYYCKMNIVDKQHASQYINKNGKAFKYDSIECMLRDASKREIDKSSLFVVADYQSPGKFVKANEAVYLISEKLPSPMGANLTGFATIQDAEKMQKQKDGKIVRWPALRKMF